MKARFKSTNKITRKMRSMARSYFGQPNITSYRLMRFEKNHNRRVENAADFRAALGIASDSVWMGFISTFVDTQGDSKVIGSNFAAAAVADHAERRDDARVAELQNKLASLEARIADMIMAATADLKKQHAEQLALAKAQTDVAKALAEKLKAELAAKPASTENVLTIIVNDAITRTQKKLDMAHRTTPDLLRRIKNDVNTFLVGPAGSGKTMGCELAAAALGLEFRFMSVGKMTTKSDILGYMDAMGKYVTTQFRLAYEFGGVFLFDEIDAGNGGVLTCLNAALAGTSASFPDAIVKRHPDFRCVAAGNTYGTGPDKIYVGRLELDGASLDRFDQLEWAYDEALEKAILMARVTEKQKEIAAQWLAFVTGARKAVSQLGLRYVISPRATLNGIKLLVDGEPVAQLKQTQVWKAMKPDEVARIVAQMKANGYPTSGL